ncbi:MAG: signal peptide peptidase SppA [Proteobacteria bacterium]|nr:signal peptide peptidase SppA [Pseudomonadota bacterium]
MKRVAKFKRLKGFFTLVGAVFSILIVLAILISLVAGDSALALGDKVGIVKIDGVIVDSIDINRQIREFAKRDDIKAVVIRINSPGGSVAPSQEIYSEVRRLAKEKDVIASMSSVAASGGYYIALGADSIVANPGTITGSIGVIVQFMNFEGLLSKIGLKGSVIKSGEFKDTGSPLRQMNEVERKVLQALVDDVQRQFVDAVVEGRELERKVVEKLADGRIFSGAQALEFGLVDSVGGLREAVELAAELAGIDGEPATVYSKKKVDGFFQYFTGEEPGAIFGSLYSGLNVLYLARPFN